MQARNAKERTRYRFAFSRSPPVSWPVLARACKTRKGKGARGKLIGGYTGSSAAGAGGCQNSFVAYTNV